MKYYAQVPFTFHPKTPLIALIILLSIDLVFLALHLFGAHPIVQAHFGQAMDCINLNVEGNLPTNWAIIQLYFGAICCFLMIFTYPQHVRAPFFWKIGTFALFLLGLDESAQLHELWSAGIFPLLFGGDGETNRPTAMVYAVILGIFYLSALRMFLFLSSRALFCFVLSGVSLVLSQADEIELPVIKDLLFAIAAWLQGWFPEIDLSDYELVVEEGFEMGCYSLLVVGVLTGICVIQRQWRLEATATEATFI